MDEPKSLLPLMNSREIVIEVPWGFIAAKEYGNPNGIPVLAIHGWLENCGSFDPLMPYIVRESNLHVVAFDEPGCGLSSHKPIGSDYERWSTLKEMKRIIQYMGWKSVSLIGHSEGGHFALIFAALYPELVERVISIDMIKPFTLESKNPEESIVDAIDSYLLYDDKLMRNAKLKTSVRIYSEEEAINKWQESTYLSLNEQSTKILMKRGVKVCRDGFVFTRDIRLKLQGIEPLISNEVMLTILSNIRCDLLLISTKINARLDDTKVIDDYINCYTKNCRIFRNVSMDGTHHLHMNDPDLVGPKVNQFIRESLAAGPVNDSKEVQSKL